MRVNALPAYVHEANVAGLNPVVLNAPIVFKPNNSPDLARIVQGWETAKAANDTVAMDAFADAYKDWYARDLEAKWHAQYGEYE